MILVIAHLLPATGSMPMMMRLMAMFHRAWTATGKVH